jgi:hypothetical protein
MACLTVFLSDPTGDFRFVLNNDEAALIEVIGEVEKQ